MHTATKDELNEIQNEKHFKRFFTYSLTKWLNQEHGNTNADVQKYY